MKRITLVAGLVLGLVTTSPVFTAEPNMATRPHANDLGIWKAFSAKGLRGEFSNYDPVGLMAGDLIHTDCSISYTDADTHKTYCFNSATSQVYFSNWPKTYAARAAAAYQKAIESVPTQ